MKLRQMIRVLRWPGRLGAGLVASIYLLGQSVIGQTIPNPSFEADTFTIFPGYTSDNGPITGWVGSPAERVGLNPASGSPFANNGTIPDGSNVAFIQSNATDPSTPTKLSTTISGLSAGTTYKVTFRANGRVRTADVPRLKVYVDQISVLLPGLPGSWPDGFAPGTVGGAAGYWYVAFEFTANAATAELSLVNDANGDHTVVVDDFKIAPSTQRWSVEAWNSDGDSGIDPDYVYTHAYSFGSSEDTTVNDVNFTGVGGANPAVAGQFSTTLLGNVYNGDDNGPRWAGGGGEILGRDFLYSSAVAAGSYESITLEGLSPGTEYLLSVFSVGWENASETARWATCSMGDDYLTFNQDQFGNDVGIRLSYRYTADASGSATFRIAPFQADNVSIHIYGFANRETTPRPAAPKITAHPKSTIVSPGLTVGFKVTASAVPLPTYQWRWNGNNLPGEINNTLVVNSVSAANAGLYDVVVANSVGSVTSQVARLTVGAINIINPSFEEDEFYIWPGYLRNPSFGENASSIIGWNSLDDHGINPVRPPDGRSPFGDNGAIPQGSQIAFMQGNGELSQTLSGFTVGGHYYVHYYENARSEVTRPGMEVKVNGNTVVPLHSLAPVGGSNPYREVSSAMFTATATDLSLAFIKSAPEAGDCTALIDNVAIVQVAPGTPPSLSSQPQSVSVVPGSTVSFSTIAQGSLPLSYQWYHDGTALSGETNPGLSISAVGVGDIGDYTVVVANSSGSVTSVVAELSLVQPIYSLRSTGIGANGLPQANGIVTPFWVLTENPDSGSADVFVANDDQFPISTGNWLASSAASKWVAPRATAGDTDIAMGNYRYRTTFDLSGRDTSTVVINGRWSTDNAGVAVYVNDQQVNVPLSTGFSAWTAFTITSADVPFIAGNNTMDFVMANIGEVGPSGLRVEFTQTSTKVLPGLPVSIVSQPQGVQAIEGDNVVLKVIANGSLPFSYQWRKNGQDLVGETQDTLTLVGVTGAAAGTYTVRVSNPWGDEVSSGAYVDVAFQVIPGIFGTGVGANGALLGDGAVDPHYVLSVSADWNFPGPDAVCITNVWPIAPAGPWLANGPSSRWIGASSNQRQDIDPLSGNLPGLYTYQTTFDLTGYDLSKVRVIGGVAADNAVNDVLLNGVSTGVTVAGFGGLNSFTFTSGLVAGENTVDFILENALTGGTDSDSPNPAGLRVDLRGLLDIRTSLPEVTLTVGASGNNITISWSPVGPDQKLQWAPDVTGPWTEIPGATSPYQTTSTGTQRFFRIAQ
ncbi:MAG: immunoglobulin domain-containing protein [Verrucomicrobiae bacterium]|nr:immunoglobulin domain-containing protein [Verrucomicrobiae bacterium]